MITVIVGVASESMIVGRGVDLMALSGPILIGITLLVPFTAASRNANWLGGGIALSAITGGYIGGAGALVSFALYRPQLLLTLPAAVALLFVLAGFGTWLLYRRRSRRISSLAS